MTRPLTPEQEARVREIVGADARIDPIEILSWARDAAGRLGIIPQSPESQLGGSHDPRP